MGERDTVLRSMHDTGLAAWFGGSLMGAVGLNGAAAKVEKKEERLAVASMGWSRWAPVSLTAIAAHLAGATGILLSERRRVVGQRGVAAMSAAKTGLTLAAIGATAYSGTLGLKLNKAGHVPVEGPTKSADDTPRRRARDPAQATDRTMERARAHGRAPRRQRARRRATEAGSDGSRCRWPNR